MPVYQIIELNDSTTTVADPNAAWTNEANAFDGSISTFATAVDATGNVAYGAGQTGYDSNFSNGWVYGCNTMSYGMQDGATPSVDVVVLGDLTNRRILSWDAHPQTPAYSGGWGIYGNFCPSESGGFTEAWLSAPTWGIRSTNSSSRIYAAWMLINYATFGPKVEANQESDSGGATVTSLNCVAPSGITNEDLLLIVAVTDDATTGDHMSINTTNFPGWTKEIEHGDAAVDCHAAVFWKISDGTDTDVTLDLASTDEVAATYIRISGADQTTPISDSAGNQNANKVTNHTPPNLTVDRSGSLSISVVGFDGADADLEHGFGSPGAYLCHLKSGTSGNDVEGYVSMNWHPRKSPASVQVGGRADSTALVEDGWVGVSVMIQPPNDVSIARPRTMPQINSMLRR